MHQAVRDALDYIQDQCGFARVGAQGQRIERVPLMFALFPHSSSRAGDVQFHIHAVCPNVTKHAGGRTTAIDSTAFYHHMMSGGAIFRASLSAGLRDLGFEIERDKSCFRIKGISEELCQRTSQRRAEILDGILERCGKLGRLAGFSEEEILKATSGRMAELVNLETRRAKKERSWADVALETRGVARELGIPDDHIDGLIRHERDLSPREKAEIKEGIYARAIEKLTDQHSHWNERDLTRMLAEESQGKGLNGPDVRELVAHKLAGQELVRIGELVTEPKNEGRNIWRERSEDRFTTKEILELEAGLLSAAQRMSKKSAAVDERTVKAVIEVTRDNLVNAGRKT
nr:relaxase domain-containing protein [Rubrobacter sp.]